MGYYKAKFHCTVCGVTWKGKLKDLNDPDPPCPNLACGAEQQIRGMDFDSTRAPAAVGMSNSTKAIDATAEIVMADYKLGDLKSDVRPGETTAPKLAPALQAQADAVFRGGRARANSMKMPASAGVLRARINSGAYAPGRGGTPDVVGDLHRARPTVPITTIASDRKPGNG